MILIIFWSIFFIASNAFLIFGTVLIGCIEKKASTERQKQNQTSNKGTSISQQPLATTPSAQLAAPSTPAPTPKQAIEAPKIYNREITPHEKSELDRDMAQFKGAVSECVQEVDDFYRYLNGLLELRNDASPELVHEIKSPCIISTLNGTYATISINGQSIQCSPGKNSNGIITFYANSYSNSNVGTISSNNNYVNIESNGNIIQLSPNGAVIQCPQGSLTKINGTNVLQWSPGIITRIAVDNRGTKDIIQWTPGNIQQISHGINGNIQVMNCF